MYDQIGLTTDWVTRIVAQVGNCCRVFERKRGSGSQQPALEWRRHYNTPANRLAADE